MRLSEALRKGAKEYPEWCEGQFSKLVFMGGKYVEQRCALGAAHAVAGLSDSEAHLCRTLWPLLNKRVSCSPCDYPYSARTVFAWIAHLNDFHRGVDWSIEDIADWVESLEAGQEAPVEVVEETPELVACT